MRIIKKIIYGKRPQSVLIILSFLLFLTLVILGGFELYKYFGPLGKLPAYDWIAKNLQEIRNINPHNFCFAVFGDNRDNDNVFADLLDEVEDDQEISFAIHLGDLVHYGGKSEYCNSLKLIQEHFHKPLLTIVGNHDIRGIGGRFYRKIFGPFYYSFQIGKTFFIVADTSKSKKVDKQQKRWLEAELLRSQNCLILVFAHQPLYDPREGHHHCLSPRVGNELMMLFHKYHVAHIFHGHIHSYFQGIWNGLPYTISAGAGAPLAGKGPEHYFFHYIKVRITPQNLHLEVVPVYQTKNK